MQRPAYYGLLALSILVAAAASAVGVTRYLSGRMYAPPRPLAPSASGPSELPRSVPAPEGWTNVFSPSAGMTAPEKPAAGGNGAATVPSGTVFALVGTIASESAEAARAILWSEGMREPRMYRLRQEIEPGATLVRIERDAVWIQRGKSREKLELLPVGSKVRIAAPPASPGVAPAGRLAPAAAVSGGADIRVTRIGENTYSMDEASLNQLTGNFNQFMTQVRLIPYFEGNKNAGYRVAAIRPGTAFEKMGFSGGDVIQAINGIELTTPERMFTVFQNLKDEKRVAINVLRQGQKTTLTYEIR